MKTKFILVLIVLSRLVLSAAATTPAPLTTLESIRRLSNAEATEQRPVAFEATVTYFRGNEGTLFVQDGGVAIYVLATINNKLLPGDRVLVKGTTQPSFHPVVFSSDVAVLRHGALPTPPPADFPSMMRGSLDCEYVTVRGKVLFASPDLRQGHGAAKMELSIPGGEVSVMVDGGAAPGLKGLRDAEVEISGVVSGRFDSKMQLTGIVIRATSFEDVKIVHPAPNGADDLPLTPMNEVLNNFDVEVRSHRVRVQGTITYYHPAWMAVLQEGDRSIRVLTPENRPMRVGDQAEATGIPVVQDGFPTLDLGEIESTGEAPAIAARKVTWDDLEFGKFAFELVSIEGTIVTQMREQSQDIYIISADGNLFSAVLRHPYSYDPGVHIDPPAMRAIAAGSKVRVTGVATFDDANRFNSALTFGLLLRSASDIEVIANPSLLSVRNLILVAGLLGVAVLGFGAWGWALDRKVRLQATALAARIETEANLERRRAQILEDINGSRPLAEIVEQIAELVSFKLGGVPCWCQIHDGARLGTMPHDPEEVHVFQQEIPSRTGQSLGTLFACLALAGPPSEEESEAIAMGVGLVELAVENRRLYSDLLRRSEFDQLTDIHNRFSLEKHLDAVIAEARDKASVFGIIYIDLDGFKQINDRYGHQSGDVYLQEVARRMKSQLRAGDLLARLGGDEFAALAPRIRGRADLEDVAHRLESCFRDPFAVDRSLVYGSASMGIAMYPEDGSSKDDLLNAADAAMYLAKHARLQAPRQLALELDGGDEQRAPS